MPQGASIVSTAIAANSPLLRRIIVTPTAGTIINPVTGNTVVTNIVTQTSTSATTYSNIINDLYLSFVTDTRPIHTWTGTGWDTSTTCSDWIIQNWNYPGAMYVLSTADLTARSHNLKKVRPPDPRPIRSAIKKGLKLITGLGFGDEIKVFLGGSSVEVSHPESEFKFVLTKNRDIFEATRYPGASTPYKLELYTKTNVFISRLCVIMEQTPVLDQVLAMIMFIRSGDEHMILKAANYPGLTSDRELRGQLALRHPHLREKLAA